MKKRYALVVLGAAVFVAAQTGRPVFQLEPVPLKDVDITDDFWAPKMQVNRTASIHHLFEKMGDRGFDNPRVIEALSYMVEKSKDAELSDRLEKMVDREVAATPGRIQNPVRVSGYVYEAAVAYYHATGSRRMLDEALKVADALDAQYGPGKKTYISGHEGMKTGLMALYKETGNPRYEKLAQFFLDERGKDDYPRTGEYAIDRTYAQDDKPVIKQMEAEGHCVRATYLYIPFTEIASYTGGPDYNRAINSIWQDAVYRKTYVTGAIGSVRFHEQYGQPYELPNLSAWNETCASYGNFVWNEQMFLLHRDAQYADVMERVLYNGFLDGVSLKGDRFFYQNPLMSWGNYDRFDWIDTPCCPPNVVRLMASLGSYVYAKNDDSLYVNLYVGSDARISMGGSRVRVRQETRYPWDGAVKIAVDPDSARKFAMYVRIPGWTGNQVMAGDLYRFMDRSSERVTLKVNGRTVNPTMANGYARIEREWKAGDSVELAMPMPVRRVTADPRVKDDEGRVALERGPLMYAAEWPDNGGHALNIVLTDKAPVKAQFRKDLLNGVEVIQSPGLTAIPYYSWANRGMGEMQVWLPRTQAGAMIAPTPLPAGIAAVHSSGGVEKKWTGYNDQNDDLAAVYDGADPIRSADESHRYFRMRPPVGERAWIEYQFQAPTKVSESEVYFADDQRFCKIPTGWRLSYKDGAEWKPIAADYSVAKDKFNTVRFAPVMTTAVRIEVEPQTKHYKSGEIGPPGANFLSKDIDWRELGVIEWRVK